MSTRNSNGDVQYEKLLFPFKMDHLPESFWKKSEVELNETPENKREKVQELKTMIEGNQATRGFNFEEDFLVQYLRHGKYDAQRAYKQILNYVVLREKHSHLFRSIPDDYFQKFKNSMQFVCPLPKRSADGCTIMLSQTGKWDPSEMAFDDILRLSMMTFCQVMRDPMTQINGFRVIHDFKGTSWSHFKYCTPRNMHFLFHATIDCVPARYKSIHFVNESFVLKAVWNIIKIFLSAKIKSRVFFHDKMEELLDYFPRSVLPVEYGGDLLDATTTEWTRKANKNHQTNTINGQPNFY